MRARIVAVILLLGIGGTLLVTFRRTGSTWLISGMDEGKIQKFCTTCHAFPLPGILPKSAWPEQVKFMYTLVPPAQFWPANCQRY